jgi:glyoxylase-like metal-dependent hydrolase (beta-lactamase superfamily II)
MLGDIVSLADNLWLIFGDMPADVPNVLAYRHGERMYLLDSGAGPTIRASILKVLHDVGPVESFTLLNSHGHADHVGNNDVIRLAQAKQRNHYIAHAGLPLLDAPSYFASQFSTLSAYYDPTAGYQVHRMRWRAAGVGRDVAQAILGERRTLELFFARYLRRFGQLRPSPETMRTYESLPTRPFVIGDVTWTGWALGDNDVWVLPAGGHTPDQVLFYLPDHQLLHTADLTVPLFPTFPASNGPVTRSMLNRCHTMAAAGAVRLLTDGHHHMVYRGRDETTAFLGTLLAEHDHFQAVLRQIVDRYDGLTVAQIYAQVRQRLADPVVQHYLSLEFPYFPMALQQVITVSLLELGYEARGPRRRQRFYRRCDRLELLNGTSQALSVL